MAEMVLKEGTWFEAIYTFSAKKIHALRIRYILAKKLVGASVSYEF